ncbi:MAG: sulfotransferase [Anaerolineales bacterium]|nr:sulfotransferase [Anaerolineales bacterium]MCX7756423.1 sulfotransferase [Anaerolineales bacterium]MDW8277750.1 sulfotransferase [Anaerolineales bacterium]
MKNVEALAHAYIFNPPANWKRILAQNPRVAPRYWPRLARMQLTGWLVEPLRQREAREYHDVVARTPVHPQPIFIMGLWRSGTTYLHHLMGMDPNLGYATTLQCLIPGTVLKYGPVMQRFFSKFLPKTRPFDNVSVELDTPQEEELAVANLFPYSQYHSWMFPQRSRLIYEKYMRLNGLTSEEYREWRSAYLWVLRQTSYLQGGKPLVLKSPTNLTRVRALLELFPEARFIEIVRNPLRTWLSYQHLQNFLLRMHHLQDYQRAHTREDELYIFTESIRQWYADKALIPVGHLVSVRYEDLVAHPLREMQRIYEALGLSSHEVLPRWKQYLAGVADYKTNRLQASEEEIKLARQHFAFLYEAGGYTPDW